MSVGDNTIAAKLLDDFFKSLGRKGLKVSKKMSENVLENPGRALEIRANAGTAVKSRSFKVGLWSLQEKINFFIQKNPVYFKIYADFKPIMQMIILV